MFAWYIYIYVFKFIIWREKKKQKKENSKRKKWTENYLFKLKEICFVLRAIRWVFCDEKKINVFPLLFEMSWWCHHHHNEKRIFQLFLIFDWFPFLNSLNTYAEHVTKPSFCSIASQNIFFFLIKKNLIVIFLC